MSGRWIIALLLLLPPAAAAQEPASQKLAAVAAMLEDGPPGEAESELRRLLAGADSAAARDLLGITLTRLGRLEEAETELARAARLRPDWSPPRQHLARLFLQQGRAEEPLPHPRAGARLGPLDHDLALWLAETELSLGNEARAREQLRSAAERFGSVRALLQLAKLQARAGDNEGADRLLQRAQEIAPNSEDVLAARAKVALAIQMPVPAILALEPLTRMHPTVADYSYLLGVARLQIGDLSNAINALQRSIELEPGRPLALVALSTTLSAQKRFEEARDVARHALRLDPQNAEALAVLAEAEEGLGNLEPAEEHARQALARMPDQARALATTGRIRMAQERYEEARDAFLAAAASAPRTARTHYQLSLAYARLGDRESSREHLELYRRFRQESDARLVELRTAVGIRESGMGRP